MHFIPAEKFILFVAYLFTFLKVFGAGGIVVPSETPSLIIHPLELLLFAQTSKG